MFIFEKPIETEKEDFLGRKRFSQHLGKALLDWKEKESLVIAIYGEWGSGKSSVINLATENIKKSYHENKPTIIEFNPWIFSEEGNLGGHFFNEIAKELEISKDTEKDKQLAKQLKFYASLLGLASEEKSLSDLSSKALSKLALIGIVSSQLITWLKIPPNWIPNIILVFSLLLLIVGALRISLTKVSEFLEKRSDYYSKSVSEVKREIKKELINRQKKIVIVIDDIDRLNQSEIRQVFRLIRVNADFPNTIYLLAFDRKIVEKNLEEQVGISGEDYLKKIVQVTFDVPFVKPSKISVFLFQELDRVLSILPPSAQKYFDNDDTYWANIYNSGFKDFFKNIRDVKRFASSLEFNISQMYQGEIMEVNPVDFISIEAIRVFAPDFYLFMRNKSALFTSTSRDIGVRELNSRKEDIEKNLNELSNDEAKEAVRKLIRRLFPQVDGILQQGYSSYGHEWQSTWSNRLRVCATNNFDAYFTLIPGGDEDELSQFEIEDILNKSDSEEDFEEIIREYIDEGKIVKVLQRIQDFTDDQGRISQADVKNVVGALFNISDDLPEEIGGMWDLSSDIHLMRIIYQLMRRETDKNKNFDLLKEKILSSKSIWGPVKKVSLESSRAEKDGNLAEFVVPEDKLEELKRLGLEKIQHNSPDTLLKNKNFLSILYRWKEWDKEDKWKEFIKKIADDDTKLLVFLTKFISKMKSQTIGDYGVKINIGFNYKALDDFMDLSDVKLKLEEIKKQNNKLYKDNKEVIDLFLDDFRNLNSDLH